MTSATSRHRDTHLAVPAGALKDSAKFIVTLLALAWYQTP